MYIPSSPIMSAWLMFWSSFSSALDKFPIISNSEKFDICQYTVMIAPQYWIVTKILSPEYCHQNIVTRVLSPEYCHRNIVTEILSPEYCHRNIVTRILSPECCHQNIVTGILSPECCHQNVVTRILSPEHFHQHMLLSIYAAPLQIWKTINNLITVTVNVVL